MAVKGKTPKQTMRGKTHTKVKLTFPPGIGRNQALQVLNEHIGKINGDSVSIEILAGGGKKSERYVGKVFGEVIGRALARDTATLSISAIVIPERRVAEGILLRSTSEIWHEIVVRLKDDWRSAHEFSAEQWE